MRHSDAKGLKTKMKRDISFLIGTWDSDPKVEKALEDQRKIDPELWS